MGALRAEPPGGHLSTAKRFLPRGMLGLLAIGLGVAAVVAVASRGTGPGSRQRSISAAPGARSAAASVYPVLDSDRPNGIEVVPPARAQEVRRTKAKPVWVAVAPSGPLEQLPVISTARLIEREGAARRWVAESTGGGVCILDFDPATSPQPATDHAVVAYCNRSSELARGVIVTTRRGATSHLLGVVPAGVRGVSVAQTAGTAISAPVHNNTYSVTTATPPTEVAFTWDGVRQRYSFQPNRRT